MITQSFDTVVLRAAARRQTRRNIATVALFLPIFAWLLNLAIPQVGNRSCPWMTRAEVLQISIAPASSIMVAIFLMLRPSTSARVVVQGILWAGLALSAVGIIDEPGLAPMATPAMALGCGLALFTLEELGLEPEKFRAPLDRAPLRTAYGAAVTVIWAQLIALLSVGTADGFRMGLGEVNIPILVGIGALVVAVVALTRLRIEATFVAAAGNVIVAVVALDNLHCVPVTLKRVHVASAVIEIMIVLYLARQARRFDSEMDLEIAAHLCAIARGVALLVALGLVVWAIWGVTPDAILRGCTN